MPNDFSAFALFVAGLATIVSAQVGGRSQALYGPTGNPISKPNSGEVVPAGVPYDITWQPTCEGTVTLLLLGGLTDVTLQVVEPAIVEKIPNVGTYSWIPQPGITTHTYGIQLICDSTNEFQYSMPFKLTGEAKKPTETETPVVDNHIKQPVTPVVENHIKQPVTPVVQNPTKQPGVAPVGNPHIHNGEVKVANHAIGTPVAAHIEIVHSFVTFCPSPTQINVNNFTYTVTSATTLTITNCPCTVTRDGDDKPVLVTPPPGPPAPPAPPASQSPAPPPRPAPPAPKPVAPRPVPQPSVIFPRPVPTNAPYVPSNSSTIIVFPTGTAPAPTTLRPTAPLESFPPSGNGAVGRVAVSFLTFLGFAAALSVCL